MDRPLVAVVLAGGVGSRLYPASRSHRPKQFLALGGEESLLARTVSRAAPLADDVVVVTRPAFADDVRDHAPEADVLVEPAGKDTGPALTYATHHVAAEYGNVADPVVLALPSDHHVGGDFAAVARRGARVAADTGSLVAFGITPTRPDPGYGYVEPGADHGAYCDLAAFHEKPDEETAARYVDAGYLWNAGIFAWTPDAFLAAARDSPLSALVAALDDGDPAAGFDVVDPVSVDYAVMERTENAVVVPADVEWDDLGSWDALARVLPTDDDGNAVLGDAELIDAEDCVVAGDTHVSLVGVSGLAVVAWDDRVLVVPKSAAQRVRELVAELEDQGKF
ncbi:MAG: mannose-1-phosphate guanylyltransferase [Haloferacaceae archaeon]